MAEVDITRLVFETPSFWNVGAPAKIRFDGMYEVGKETFTAKAIQSKQIIGAKTVYENAFDILTFRKINMKFYLPRNDDGVTLKVAKELLDKKIGSIVLDRRTDDPTLNHLVFMCQ